LTVLYHVTQRNINIRKETSISISVFSIASFISMVALLIQLNGNQKYSDVPLVIWAKIIWVEIGKVGLKLLEYGNMGQEL
jgi:hypothetical protein